MKATWHPYPNEYQMSWDVPGGQASVFFDLFGAFVEFDEGTRSPKEFTYLERSDNPNLPGWVIECEHGEDFAPRIRGVHAIARTSGREVRSVDLRRLRSLEDVVVDAWLRVSRRPAIVRQEGTPIAAQDAFATATEIKRTIRGLRAQARRRVTPQVLDEVSRVYRENAAGGAPTKAVGQHFGIAASTASLYVKRARDAGHVLPRVAARTEAD